MAGYNGVIATQTLTQSSVLKPDLHENVVYTYLVKAANTIAAGDIVTVSSNEIIPAVSGTHSTDLGVAVNDAAAQEDVMVCWHGGVSKEKTHWAATPTAALTQANVELLKANNIFVG